MLLLNTWYVHILHPEKHHDKTNKMAEESIPKHNHVCGVRCITCLPIPDRICTPQDVLHTTCGSTGIPCLYHISHKGKEKVTGTVKE
jgi:hypothetical protein